MAQIKNRKKGNGMVNAVVAESLRVFSATI